jgi:hypothetical protein
MSSFDWALISEIVSIISTIAFVVIGGLGLNTWRRQLKGTNEYELAKNVVLKTYEVQQALQQVRNPMLYLKKEEVEAGKSLEEEQRIYDERMQKLFSKWIELQTLRLESKVVWGDEAFNCINSIQKLIGEMKGAIWLHFWLKGAFAGPGATVDKSPERIRENDKIVYYTSDEDEFSIKIEKAVDEVEKIFINKVRK